MSKHGLTRRSALKLGMAGAATAAFGSGLGSFGARAQSAPEISAMSWGGAAGVRKIVTAIADSFPDIAAKYNVQAVDGGPGDQDVAAAIRLGLASGQNLPEIVQLNRTQVSEFAASGELLELDDVYADIADEVYAGALELARVDGRYVGVPYELKSKMFYYRQDLFDKAGVNPASMATVDDFMAAGKAIKETADSHIINLGPQPSAYLPGEFLSAYKEARFFADSDGNYDFASSVPYKETFTFIKSLYDSGLTLKIDDWSSDWQPAIADGKIASFLCASWLKLFLPTFVPDQTGLWKAALWPELSPLADQSYGSEAGGSVFVVLKRSKNPEAAAEYLRKVFLEPQGAIVAFNTLGMTPLIQSARDEFLELSANPKKPDGMSDEDFAVMPANFFGSEIAKVELASYDRVRVLPYDPAASRGLDILNQWLRKFVTGSADLDTALQNAEADMRNQIGNPYNF